MRALTLHQVEQTVLDIVAPGWRDMNVRAATLRLEAGRCPEVTLECHVLRGKAPAQDLAQVVRHYHLVAITPPPAPLGLQEAVDAARARLASAIAQAAEEHSAALRKTVDDIRRQRRASRHQPTPAAQPAPLTLRIDVDVTDAKSKIAALAEQLAALHRPRWPWSRM